MCDYSLHQQLTPCEDRRQTSLEHPGLAVSENRRHSRGLGWRALVSGWQMPEFCVWTGGFAAAVSARHFSNFCFGMPETGSICDGDRFAESISRLHRRQRGKMD